MSTYQKNKSEKEKRHDIKHKFENQISSRSSKAKAPSSRKGAEDEPPGFGDIEVRNPVEIRNKTSQ